MSEFRLHCFAQSGNAYKPALMLALSGADWEAVPVDFFGGETRTAAYRAGVNEMGEAPVLEHKGRKLSQSGVILTYLARRLGTFAPGGEEEELEALRWMLFDNHKFTSYFATYRFLMSLAPQAADPAVLAFLKTRADAALAIAERHLAGMPYMLGERPTIADLSMCGYLFYPVEEHGYDFSATHPAIAAWLGRIKALPGWKDPYALMPGKRFLADRATG
jgi:glutathione S-transferase